MVNGDALLPQPVDHGELQDMAIKGQYPDRSKYLPYVPQALKRCINRAMNVDPQKRFQNASSFRRSLERIQIFCEWQHKQLKRRTLFRTKCNNATIKVRISKNKGRFDILTTKEINGGAVRRIGKDCETALNKKHVKRRLRQILSRYVSEGR